MRKEEKTIEEEEKQKDRTNDKGTKGEKEERKRNVQGDVISIQIVCPKGQE